MFLLRKLCDLPKTNFGVDFRQWESDKISNAHTIGCNAVSWAPFNASGVKRFVSGGCDNLVKVWRCNATDSGDAAAAADAGCWIEESRMEGHSDWVRDVAWAPSIGGADGRSVVASCSQVLHQT